VSADFVTVDLATENQRLTALADAYRQALADATVTLSERNAEIEVERRQNAALRAKVRALLTMEPA
jgi:hypothetical protein